MPAKKGVEQGIREDVQFRTGIDLAYWQGLSLDKDGGAIGDSELREAINVRLSAGRIDARGGQEKLNASPLDGCIWSMDDLPLPTVGLFLTTLSTAASDSLDRYNLDFSPNYTTAYQDALTLTTMGRGSIFIWRSKLLVHATGPAGNGLYEVVLPKDGVVGGISVRFFLGGPAPNSAAVVPEGGDDILYMGVGTEVQRYDGTYYSTDGTVGSGAQIVGRFHDQLHSCGAATLLKRQPGAPVVSGISTTLYTSYPLPINPFLPSSVTEWQQRLFIVGRDGSSASGPGYILIFDGVSVTIGHTPSASLNARNVSDAIVWNGFLWYVWRELGATPHTWIGNYDGAIWNDQVADLGGTQSSSSLTGFFALANSLLYVTTVLDQFSGGGSNSQVLMSSPDGVTWTLVQDISLYHTPGATGGNVVAFPVVFG